MVNQRTATGKMAKTGKMAVVEARPIVSEIGEWLLEIKISNL
jgi:hypothetical protein